MTNLGRYCPDVRQMEARSGVLLTNLDEPLFDGADATKRQLVDYLDAIHDEFIRQLRDRPLSVIRVLRGQAPFMQKNVPRYAPSWVRRVSLWAETTRREVSYALCNDRRTLLWFANQLTLMRTTKRDHSEEEARSVVAHLHIGTVESLRKGNDLKIQWVAAALLSDHRACCRKRCGLLHCHTP